jgi:hypothetical protein
LYNILTEFGIHINLVRHINMCLNETCSRFRVDKHLSDVFPISNGLKQGDALSPLHYNFPLKYQGGLKLSGTHQHLDDGRKRIYYEEKRGSSSSC